MQQAEQWRKYIAVEQQRIALLGGADLASWADFYTKLTQHYEARRLEFEEELSSAWTIYLLSHKGKVG